MTFSVSVLFKKEIGNFRKFVLIGDSGEKDPEVYSEIRSRFPNHVEEIRIRDVVNEGEKNPS